MQDEDNVFDAINSWVKDSEKIKAQTENRVSNAESLTSAVFGKLPSNTFKRKRVIDMENSYVERYIREEVAQIDDIQVRYSVLGSLSTSIKQKNLVFKYLDALTPAQRARVRVISKLVWYNLYPEEEQHE